MGRSTQDTLNGYAFQVRDEPQVAMKDGQPVFDQGSAEPKLEVVTKLILAHPSGEHTVVIPLNETGKAELIRQLTGGIVVANGSLPGGDGK